MDLAKFNEKNDVLKEKDRYYAFIDIPQYWSVRADGLNGAIYDNKTKKANIYFKNPIEKRMVSRVEWIDRNNTKEVSKFDSTQEEAD